MTENRSIVTCVILSIVTCGIYFWYWLYKVAEDVNTVTGEQDTSGIMVLVLQIVTCNIYGIFWGYKTGEKMERVLTSRGIEASSTSIIYAALMFVCPIAAIAVVQNSLNKLA